MRDHIAKFEKSNDRNHGLPRSGTRTRKPSWFFDYGTRPRRQRPLRAASESTRGLAQQQASPPPSSAHRTSPDDHRQQILRDDIAMLRESNDEATDLSQGMKRLRAPSASLIPASSRDVAEVPCAQYRMRGEAERGGNAGVLD